MRPRCRVSAPRFARRLPQARPRTRCGGHRATRPAPATLMELHAGWCGDSEDYRCRRGECLRSRSHQEPTDCDARECRPHQRRDANQRDRAGPAARELRDGDSRIQRNSCITSRAVCQRSSGSFASARRITWSRVCGAAGLRMSCHETGADRPSDSSGDARRTRGVERLSTGEHFVQGGAEGKHVRPFVHGTPLELLRRHVVQRPDDPLFCGQGLGGL